MVVTDEVQLVDFNLTFTSGIYTAELGNPNSDTFWQRKKAIENPVSKTELSQIAVWRFIKAIAIECMTLFGPLSPSILKLED